MKFSPKSLIAATALTLCLAAGSAIAQDAMPAAAGSSAMQSDTNMQGPMKHNKNASMHKMPATVTAADAKSGIVDVTTAGMSLKVHFPPAFIANLKAGDKITLHMGYTAP